VLVRDFPIEIVLAGDGHERERLERRAAELRLDNLTFLPVQAVGRYETLLRAADVLLVSQLPSVGAMALPSKLTSYFAAGRPILAAVSPASETASELRAARAGLVVDPAPQAIAAGLRELIDRREDGVAMGKRGRRYAESVLAPERVLPEYEVFLRGLIEHPRQAGGAA
jgi:glycosyltransferase involved in cell wall biosynthesis